MAEVTNENLQILLTKLMTDRFCSGEASDLDACIQNFVPQHTDNSWVDQSLQRRGIQKCVPYQTAATRCLSDEKKQAAVFKAAINAPVCHEERKILNRCRRHAGQECEQEALEALYCGMVHLVQREKKGH